MLLGRKNNKVIIALAVFCVSSLLHQASASASCAKVNETRPGEVFFMRGLANIFSLGLDAFAAEVSDLGIRNCVFNHSRWKDVVTDIVNRGQSGRLSLPVMIIGHSLGANIAPEMATAIGKSGIPVAYVVMLDPVKPTVVGENVLEIHNYYLPKRKDTRLYAGYGFDGILENYNLKQVGGFDHFNVDENRPLRDLMERRVLELSAAKALEEVQTGSE